MRTQQPNGPQTTSRRKCERIAELERRLEQAIAADPTLRAIWNQEMQRRLDEMAGRK